ncbi:hypothetical protein [uncultured Microscilla sp.]|uniref:hypothetical protein n=1 Tax=uncultured Microscilla sp. TaxID=432653 RepID=UPI0026296BF2|nr:hypothetical protein [uncultured Microscilla sp.]
MELTNDKPHQLNYNQAYQFFDYLLRERDDLSLQLNVKKNALIALDNHFDPIFEFRFPLPYPVITENTLGEAETPQTYFEKVSTAIPNYLMLLIQAGNAALGYFEEGEMINHKVIRKYMIRKKQGKFQGNHLKTKGKSKYGSRVRLQNTVDFFEDINQKITDWEIADDAERIIYAASITLWNMLFDSKVESPFDKADPRLRKVPKDVHIPTYEELLRINRFAHQGFVHIFQEIDLEAFFEGLLPQDSDEDW